MTLQNQTKSTKTGLTAGAKSQDTRDPYSAVWVSHSSMGDFLKCPRLYYLHNVYKNKLGRKIGITSPAMSLGVAVHNTVENLANFKVEDRMTRDLLQDYESNWQKVSGKIGGFMSEEIEVEYKARGISMIERVMRHPGPLVNKTVHFPPRVAGQEKVDMLPHFFLNDTDNIILCGKVDWLEYNPDDDSLTVIDFKTGKNEESEESLQLPIYELLLDRLQKRKVTGAKYWYLDRDDTPIDARLLPLDEAYTRVYAVAKQVAEARASGEYMCPKAESGCIHCRPYERVLAFLRGDEETGVEYVGKGEYKQDLYIVHKA